MSFRRQIFCAFAVTTALLSSAAQSQTLSLK
ncbi:alpha/beta hydrolase, partial [Mesorhizobium sp. M7A.F.Ca.CA.001.14.1.1]